MEQTSISQTIVDNVQVCIQVQVRVFVSVKGKEKREQKRIKIKRYNAYLSDPIILWIQWLSSRRSHVSQTSCNHKTNNS